jgi:hypothetical protein
MNLSSAIVSKRPVFCLPQYLAAVKVGQDRNTASGHRGGHIVLDKMVLPTPVTEPEVAVLPGIQKADTLLQELIRPTYTTSTLKCFFNGARVQLRNPNPY